MAKVASSSSASMAPCAAMMAETPQIEEPTASKLVSLGFSLNALPKTVMSAMATTSSMATRASEMPGSRRPSRDKRSLLGVAVSNAMASLMAAPSPRDGGEGPDLHQQGCRQGGQHGPPIQGKALLRFGHGSSVAPRLAVAICSG